MSSNPDVPAVCQHFATAIDGLDQQIANLEDELNNAPGIEILILRQRIQALQRQRAREQMLLDACIANPQPEPAPPPDFISIWTAVATVRTDNPRAPGPFTQTNFVSALNFPVGCQSVRLVGFSLTLPNGISVQQAFGALGTFNAETGEMNIPITLGLHVPQIPFGDSDSIVEFSAPGFTTEVERSAGPFNGGQGVRLNRITGQFTLVGTGIVSQNAFINGTIVEVRLDGVLSPVPCV